MNYLESFATAETELREAILQEFLKPELPQVITLLRHSAQFLIKRLDIEAESELEYLFAGGTPACCFAADYIDVWPGGVPTEKILYSTIERYCAYIDAVVLILPDWFFGRSAGRRVKLPQPRGPLLAHYGTSSAASVRCLAPGSPWARCIEYGLLARVDHSSNLPGTDEEIFKRYGPVNGHLFLKYALRARQDYWRSEAAFKFNTVPLLPPPATPTGKRTCVFVDDQHKLCVNLFDKIRESTPWVFEEWLHRNKLIKATFYRYYRHFEGNLPKQRARIELAIFNTARDLRLLPSETTETT